MRKKSGFTMVERVIVLAPEFEKVAGKLEQQVTLRGQSKSTLNKIRENNCPGRFRPGKGGETATANLKERGNNNAKRKEFFDMETIIEDVYPDDPGFDKNN